MTVQLPHNFLTNARGLTLLDTASVTWSIDKSTNKISASAVAGGIAGAALTRTNDTNVTLTLGGTPGSALLQATSLTVGWTGQLGLARGGTAADLSGTGGASQVLKQVTAGGAVTVGQLAYTDITGLATVAHSGAYADLSGTPTIPSAANPSASVGTSAVNGSAATFMRSDGAPAIDQTMAPSWSGKHTFTNATAWVISAAAPFNVWTETDQTTDEKSWAVLVNSKVFGMRAYNDALSGAGSAFLAVTRGTGVVISSMAFGNATDNPTYSFLGTGTVSAGGALSVTGVITAASGTATPAGGSTAARILLGTTSGFGIYYGSGAPTVSAAKGSLYIRSDGTTTNDRAYINTNGSTTWTALTTVA